MRKLTSYPPLGLAAVSGGAGAGVVFAVALGLAAATGGNQNPGVELAVMVLTNAGVGLVIVAATLGGVQATLSTEERRQQRQERERRQLELLERARTWALEEESLLGKMLALWDQAETVKIPGHLKFVADQMRQLALQLTENGAERIEGDFLAASLDDDDAASAVRRILASRRGDPGVMAPFQKPPWMVWRRRKARRRLVEDMAAQHAEIQDAARVLEERHSAWLRSGTPRA